MTSSSTGPIAAAVVVDGDRLVIRQLVISDPDVAAIARNTHARGDDLDAWLQIVIRAGAAATAAATSGADLGRVQRALEQVSVDVASVVGSALGQLEQRISIAADPKTGLLAQASNDAVMRLSEGVQKILLGQGAMLPSTIERSVRGVTDLALAEISRLVAGQAAATVQAVHADRDAVRQAVLSVVDQHHVEIRSALTDLSRDIAVSNVRKSDRADTPKAGEDFELFCLDLINNIAIGCADAVEHTGRKQAKGGGFVGDMVVELSGVPGAVRRMTIEAKARKSPPSLVSLRDELRKARRGREAVVSLALCPSDRMPGGSQARIVVLEECALAVAVDLQEPDLELLQAAYLMCRLAALSDRPSRAGKVDTDAIRHQLVEMRATIDRLDTIEKLAASTQKTAGTINANAAEIKSGLIDRLQRLTVSVFGVQDDAEHGADRPAEHDEQPHPACSPTAGTRPAA